MARGKGYQRWFDWLWTPGKARTRLTLAWNDRLGAQVNLPEGQLILTDESGNFLTDPSGKVITVNPGD